MAYQEPGVTVRRELEPEAVQVASADQEPVIIGELYEVFSDELASDPYIATTGSGTQVFEWPAKLATSIVDLAGVREDTAEPDSQLRESAAYPMQVKIKDPETLVETTLDPIADIIAVSQAGFSIEGSVPGATARLNDTDATGAENGKIRIRGGGVVAAGVKIGDRIRVSLLHTLPPVVLQGTVTSFTDLEISYSTTGSPTVDGPTLQGVDGDAVTTSGKLSSAAGGFTAGVDVGDRIALWPESLEVDDGDGTVANTVTTVTSLGLVAADVGRRVTLHSADAGDGAVSAVDGVTNGTNTLTATGLTAAMVGRVVRIAGGTGSIPATYRRVVTAGVGTLTFSGAVIAASTGASVTVYFPKVKKIATVVSGTSFTYVNPDGTAGDESAGSQTAIPIVLHSRVLRDVTVVDSNTLLTYSGSALTSGTGFLRNVPFDIFKEDVEYEVFPNYQVLVSYRALDTRYPRGIRVTQQSDLDAIGDSSSKHNPLLFAAKLGLGAMGTTDRNILLIPVNPWGHQVTATGFPSDRNVPAAYARARDVISVDDRTYYLAPLVRSTSRDEFYPFVDAESEPESKHECAVFATYELPLGEFESVDGVIEPGLDGGNKKILDPGKALVTGEGITPGSEVVVTFPDAYAGTYLSDAATTDDELVLQGANWTLTPEYQVTNGDFNAVSGQVTSVTTGVWKDVDVGDWLVSGGQYRKITTKVNNQTLAYAGAVITGTGATVAILRSSEIVYHVNPLSADGQAQALKAIAVGVNNFRVVPVWPDQVEFVTGQDEFGEDVKEYLDSYFLAAAEACRLSTMRPERSDTDMSIVGPTGLKHSNTYFSRTQLNTIAEGGWTIFVQPSENGPVVCRHLLSSAASTVKTAEFAVTKNYDNQAKVIRASLAPSLNDEHGRKNITKQLLNALMLPVEAVFDYFVSKEQIVEGPNGEKPYTIISLTVDPNKADGILLTVRGQIPIAANTLDITYVI